MSYPDPRLSARERKDGSGRALRTRSRVVTDTEILWAVQVLARTADLLAARQFAGESTGHCCPCPMIGARAAAGAGEFAPVPRGGRECGPAAADRRYFQVSRSVRPISSRRAFVTRA
jgi:hypothetical protein